MGSQFLWFLQLFNYSDLWDLGTRVCGAASLDNLRRKSAWRASCQKPKNTCSTKHCVTIMSFTGEICVCPGTLTQWRKCHLASGGHDQTITRTADLVQEGVPLSCAASMNPTRQGSKRRPHLVYANSIVSVEKRSTESLGQRLTVAQCQALRIDAAQAFKYLPAEDQGLWFDTAQKCIPGHACTENWIMCCFSFTTVMCICLHLVGQRYV
jgi:hypothetical protein